MEFIDECLKDAAQAGDDHWLKTLLLQPQCTPGSKDNAGMTALMWAARRRDVACLNLLLPVSNALTRDARGCTALIHAACKGHEACVRLLLPVSDALAVDKDGWTALTQAAACGKTSCVQTLLPVSDVLAKVSGITALMFAAQHGSQSCVEALLPLSDALAQDNKGKTASIQAREIGHFKLADFIDAYALALGTMAELQLSTQHAAFKKIAALRL